MPSTAEQALTALWGLPRAHSARGDALRGVSKVQSARCSGHALAVTSPGPGKASRGQTGAGLCLCLGGRNTASALASGQSHPCGSTMSHTAYGPDLRPQTLPPLLPADLRPLTARFLWNNPSGTRQFVRGLDLETSPTRRQSLAPGW